MSLVKNAVDPTKGDLKKFEIRRRIRSYVKNNPQDSYIMGSMADGPSLTTSNSANLAPFFTVVSNGD